MSGDKGTHWRRVHKRKNEHLLFAEDLGGRESVDLEIVDSGVTSVSGADDSKDMPWLAFRGAKKRLALNVTNSKTMQTLTGTGVIEKWRGWITLTVVKTTFRDKQTGKKETTDAIRIAPTRPQPPKSAPQPDVAPAAEAPTEEAKEPGK